MHIGVGTEAWRVALLHRDGPVAIDLLIERLRWRGGGVKDATTVVRRWAGRLISAAAAALVAGCTTPGWTSPPAPSQAPPASPPVSVSPSALVPSVAGSPIQIPTSTPTSAPQPTPSASATTKASRSVPAFLSPSKNIECGRVPAGDSGQPAIACQIFQRTFRNPSCPSRRNQAPSSLVVYLASKQRPNAVPCVSDVVVPDRPRSSAYGDLFAFEAGTHCTVARANVRCANAAGHGFTLSRSALKTF